MNLQEVKIPKWKKKEDLFKTQSFDVSLVELGKNGAFLNAKEIQKKIDSPVKVKSCTAK